MKSAIASVLLLLVLCGCGGGNGGTNSSGSGNNSSGSTAGQAQGVYSGTTSTGTAFESIVLPNDTFYALYGTSTSTAFFVAGMMTGQGTSKNGSYTATVRDFFANGTSTAGTVSATYIVATSISGTLTENGTASSFSGTPLASSNYNFNTPAVLSTIVGTWTGTLLDGTDATVTIAANGTFTGTNLGCSFSGTISPDSSGKNFFNVALTFGSSPCVLANQTASGIGLTYLLSNNTTRQLLFGGTSGNNGTAFFAAK